MVFAMNDPNSVIVRNIKDLEWSCGPLKREEVTVIYQPSANPKLAGTIAELIF